MCYELPVRLASVAGLEICMPSPKLLGGQSKDIKAPGNLKALQRWVKNHLFENDPVIVALDTIGYGGLISSRWGQESLEIVEERIEQFFSRVKAPMVYGFSSILRIPNYNNQEEEPSYWSQYGTLLYQYSFLTHQESLSSFPKTSSKNNVESGQALRVLTTQASHVAAKIPEDVLSDFLTRRSRNFQMNQRLLSRLTPQNRGTERADIQYLVFCQDDTGAYGLNVQEAQSLASLIDAKGLKEVSHIQTGADEVACCLIARWMGHSWQPDKPIKIYPFYSSDAGKKLVAKFDGVSIETIVAQQIKACGGQLVKKSSDADIWLVVHTPETQQGDHCENHPAQVEPEQHQEVLKILKKAFDLGKPVTLADVAYANGGDPKLVQKIVQNVDDLLGLYGYAAWNTPGNSIGTAIAMGIVRYLAESRKVFHFKAFQELLFIRLADDWLYQSDVRYKIREMTPGGTQPDEGLLNAAMANGLEMLQSRLGLKPGGVSCRFPCQRTFEIELVFHGG
ncbi:MAG: DUF4127 family protein [Cyanobacteria bacterium]|nr:DUF4127 family protein [Cyanobacteriota bacterium]